jgi:hypothetical protein
MARSSNNGPIASGPERALGYVPPVRGTLELVCIGAIIGSICNHPSIGIAVGLLVAFIGYRVIGRLK